MQGPRRRERDDRRQARCSDRSRARAEKGDAVRRRRPADQAPPRQHHLRRVVRDSAQVRIDLASSFIRDLGGRSRARSATRIPSTRPWTRCARRADRRDHRLHLPETRSGWLRERPRSSASRTRPGSRSTTSSPTSTPRACRSRSRWWSRTRPSAATALAERLEGAGRGGRQASVFIVVIPQEGGRATHARGAPARWTACSSALRGLWPARRRGHDRRPRSLHGDDERAPALPRRRHRHLDLPGDALGLVARRPDRARARRDGGAGRARRVARRQGEAEMAAAADGRRRATPRRPSPRSARGQPQLAGRARSSSGCCFSSSRRS